MKALSLMQPWANLVANGDKTIEIRKWNTRFWGTFLIHASMKVDMRCDNAGTSTEPRGALIAVANLVRVIKYDYYPDFKRDIDLHLNHLVEEDDLPLYGFVLEDVKKIKPVPFKGLLNFFETGLTLWDIRALDSIEYLKCRYCGHLNELERWWRNMGDTDDSHYVTCGKCKMMNFIGHNDSQYLVRGPI